MDSRVADMLWPTLAGSTAAGIVLDARGRLALIPLRALCDRELIDACLLQHALGRGLLVVA